VAAPLLDGPAGTLTIANRTRSKADSLAGRLRTAGHESVKSADFDHLDGGFDLVINATSTGLDGQVPAIREAAVAGAFCYDMLYGADTAFCRWARQAGAGEVTDGLGMLVGQAAFAFELWRGVRPKVGPVLKTIRNRLIGGSA
jgi:shikimate dehydrogenase